MITEKYKGGKSNGNQSDFGFCRKQTRQTRRYNGGSRKNSIDIRALSVADTSDYGILRLIVNDPKAAVEALRSEGMTASATQVLGIIIPDEPGGLARAIKVLSDEQISVEYAYAFITPSVGNAYVIIRVEDNDKASEILKGAGIELIEQDDIFKK